MAQSGRVKTQFIGLGIAGVLLAIVIPLIAPFYVYGWGWTSDTTNSSYVATITLNSTTTQTNMVATIPLTLLNSTTLVNSGYMSPLADNVIMRRGGVDVPFMPGYPGVSNWTVWVPSLPANANVDYRFYTGGTGWTTGIPAYFPGVGGMTVLDNATIELGNNFTVSVDGWWPMTANVYRNPVITKQPADATKNETFALETAEAGSIVARNFGNLTVDQEQTSLVSALVLGGTAWAAQTFTAGSTYRIAQVGINSGSGGFGNMTVSVRATSAGKPTGPDLVAANVTQTNRTSGAWNYWTFPPIQLTSGTVYAIVARIDGTGENWRTTTTDVYAGGDECTSSNSGATWTVTATDTAFKVFYTDTVALTGMTQGEHPILVSGSTVSGHFQMFADDIPMGPYASTNSVATVPNNTTDWLFYANGSMPYAYSAVITIGSPGITEMSAGWTYGATFTDGWGHNTILPTFNPGGAVTATVGVLSPTRNFSASTYLNNLNQTIDITQFINMTLPGGFYGTNMSFNSTMIGAAYMNEMLDQGNFPRSLFWFPVTMLIAIACGFFVFKFSKSLLLQAIVSMFVVAMFAAAQLVPPYVILIFVIEAIAVMVAKKSYAF